MEPPTDNPIHDVKPILVIDTETSGLSTSQHALLTCAAFIVGGPNHGKYTRVKSRPHQGAILDAFALSINGYRADEIQQWPNHFDAATSFVAWLEEYLPASERIIPLGWNFRFDAGFLTDWLNRAGRTGFYDNVFEPTSIDAMGLFKLHYKPGKANPAHPKARLADTCDRLFGEPLAGAHNEVADCLATYRVFHHMIAVGKLPEYQHYLPCRLQ